MPMAPQNGMGTAAMVLGILSCCLFCLYGLPSLVLGVVAIILGVKGKQRADRGEATNRGQAQAGLVTGIVGTVLGLVAIAFFVFVIVAAINDDRNNDRNSDTDPYYNSAPSVSAPVLPQ
jgi:large-conductance mechanosensitive channel